jgi:hypothetical protein
MTKIKPHQSINAWKSDIHTLLCILRLRLSPPLPYPHIATLLLTHLPYHMLKLSNTIPRSEKLKPSFFLSNGIQDWVENYLKERFELAERWPNSSYLTAMGVEESFVEDVVRLLGLGLDGGFGVVGEREMEVQRRWRANGDWRAGSTPCFCGRDELNFDAVGMFGAVGCEREALRALRVGAVGGGEVVEEERVEDVVDLVFNGSVEKEEKLGPEKKVEEVIDSVSSSGSKGEEEILIAEEVAPPPLKDVPVPDRIRVPRVLKRGEKIPENWWEECE